MTGPLRGMGGALGAPPRVTIVDIDDADRAWKLDAACRNAPDPDLWFPRAGQSHDAAKRICRNCPVREECFEYAMRHGEKFGIWGGRSERERRRIRREQAGGKRGHGSPEPVVSFVGRQRIVWLDSQGWTDGQIAAEFGCTQRTVQRVLAKYRPS